jgi:hypothetical protein
VARQILEELNANSALVEEVCDIVGHHHHPGKDESVNFKVLYDADLITNIEENNKEKPIDREHIKQIINKSFLTESGRKKAEEILLS